MTPKGGMGRVGLPRAGEGSRGGIDLCPELPVNPDVQEPGSAVADPAPRPSGLPGERSSV